MGADWNDFHNRIVDESMSLGIDKFESYSYAYAYSGINDVAFTTFEACIHSSGFSLVAKQIGSSFYKLKTYFTPGINVQGQLPKSASGININAESIKELDTKLKRGGDTFDYEVSLVPINALKEASVTVTVHSQSKDILLPPIQTDCIPPQQIAVPVTALEPGSQLGTSGQVGTAFGTAVLHSSGSGGTGNFKFASSCSRANYNLWIEYCSAGRRGVHILVNDNDNGVKLDNITGPNWQPGDNNCKRIKEMAGNVKINPGSNQLTLTSSLAFPYIFGFNFDYTGR